MRILLPLFGN
jgi:hypothetical protein